ncbi:SDR family oxidoreductase [Arcicella aquatica]|uniref:SDR family oxidoreductase n=1 Tax=Arcicella aquatica TaxID=217141 RepID=A0ABU5QIL9_9BACT|nr:SDR family oxidoreductase [Arcicella aquatica]MEA5256888.1 SDR family oxidoreductase [Arcicella aquatica]
MFSLINKSVVITGGGSGIGRAISLLFAKQGAEVNILELNETAAQETVDEIRAEGGKANAYACNVTSQEAVKTVFASIGRVDILINNAGIAHVGNLEKTSEEDFDRIYNVNVKGAYNCLYVAVPMMKENKGGVILNMASVASSVGIADRFAYSMSKGAILTMTLSIAKDYIKENIRCNCISPARVHTPFVDGFLAKNYPNNIEEMFEKLSATQPIGRMAKPSEIAFLALYLCSDEAGFVTGSDYPIDGGFIRLNN